MKLLTSLIAVCALASGCATCGNHPVACSVAGALVVGSVAATIAANQSGGNQGVHHQVLDIPTLHPPTLRH